MKKKRLETLATDRRFSRPEWRRFGRPATPADVAASDSAELGAEIALRSKPDFDGDDDGDRDRRQQPDDGPAPDGAEADHPPVQEGSWQRAHSNPGFSDQLARHRQARQHRRQHRRRQDDARFQRGQGRPVAAARPRSSSAGRAAPVAATARPAAAQRPPAARRPQ